MDQRITCLGVSSCDGVCIISRGESESENGFRIDRSDDGIGFVKIAETDLLRDSAKINPIYQDLRLSRFDDRWILVLRILHEGISTLEISESKDLIEWNKISEIQTIHESGVLLNGSKIDDNYILFVGGKSIKVIKSKDLQKWGKPTIATQIDQSDMRHHVIVASAELTQEGILLTYFMSNNPSQTTSYSLMAMLYDIESPSHPIWREPRLIMSPQGHNLPIGAVMVNDRIVSYWQRWNGDLLAINHMSVDELLNGTKRTARHPSLKRHKANPLLEPDDRTWRSEAVFNPAAIVDENKVHLLYRAVGASNASAWGHAASTDGINFDTSDNPIYTPDTHFSNKFQIPNNPSKYISGPGWGGCEDPRAVVIDDRLYVTYVAFDGHNPQRVAITSMDMDNFRRGDWVWSTPIVLSPPNVSNKNWVLFPDKIEGKFALIHSITPKISIEYIDNFESERHINSHFAQTSRYDHWDNWVRGAGPPPVLTDDGWLLFYHAMDIHDPGRYKLGVMLLDKNNPTRILYRSRSPILEPLTDYENNGLKYGVIFATGALNIDGMLHVYYGGSDSTVNVAQHDTEEFLYNLKHHVATDKWTIKFEE